MLITSRAAREQKLTELEAVADFGNLTADGRELLARLRRNDTIADAVSRLADIAPDIDGNARRGLRAAPGLLQANPPTLPLSVPRPSDSTVTLCFCAVGRVVTMTTHGI